MRRRSHAYPPHIFGRHYLRNNWDLNISLIPVFLAGALFYGLGPSLLIFLIALLGAVFAEIIFSFALSQSFSLEDGWAVSQGILVALLLPPSCPLYLPALAAALAVFLGKSLPGGLGRSVFSPVVLALVATMILFPGAITYRWPPLEEVSQGVVRSRSWLDHFVMGSGSGALGQTSLLAIILGVSFLALRGSLNWHVPLMYILGSLPLLLFPQVDPRAQIFACDVFFFAFFVIPQEGKMPLVPKARMLYGFIAGILSVPLRFFLGPVSGILLSQPFASAAIPLLNFLFLPPGRNYLFKPARFRYPQIFPKFLKLFRALLTWLRKGKKAEPKGSEENISQQVSEEAEGSPPANIVKIREIREGLSEFCTCCSLEKLDENCQSFLNKSPANGWRFFQAMEGEDVQGVLILAPVEQSLAPLEGTGVEHVVCLRVREEKRGSGIGRLLLEHALEVSKDKAGISVLAHRDLIPSGFLEHFGFQEVVRKATWKAFFKNFREAKVEWAPLKPKSRSHTGKLFLEAVLPAHCSLLWENYRNALLVASQIEEEIEVAERVINNPEDFSEFPVWGIYLNGKLLGSGIVAPEKLKAKIIQKVAGFGQKGEAGGAT